MKTLFLVRHAKSSWDDRKIDDFDRPLNDRGRRDAPSMGKRIAGLADAPRVIVTSPAKRAATTARLIAEAIGLPAGKIVESAPLYGASPDAILGVINELDDDLSSAMLVGHNPGLTQIAAGLAPGSVDHMPTCSIAAIDLGVDSWMMVRPGKGTLRFFETPKKPSR